MGSQTVAERLEVLEEQLDAMQEQADALRDEIEDDDETLDPEEAIEGFVDRHDSVIGYDPGVGPEVGFANYYLDVVVDGVAYRQSNIGTQRSDAGQWLAEQGYEVDIVLIEEDRTVESDRDLALGVDLIEVADSEDDNE
jgi:hypothetical protein